MIQEKSEKALAVKELKEYKLNKESSVKNGASLFLKAFLESEPGEKQTTEEKIKPYASQKAQEQVKIGST
ncbi:hypothetical protein V7266_07530 [Neobacillus drentensis]|uniref:hypothetical protein n=1 Tax=Neobacillus drentensis TaxID=220684 RepID=UPI002FFEBB83